MSGPVDPPLLGRDAPAGWWTEYTAVLFDAAAQISTLLAETKAANIPFMTPIVGYSAFSAASMNVYLAAFPWADPRSSQRINAADLSRHDLEYLRDFAQMWPLGKAWVGSRNQRCTFFSLTKSILTNVAEQLRVARQTQRLYHKTIAGNSNSQLQNDIVHLRKTIEQYGTLSVSGCGNIDEPERDSMEPLSPAASVHDASSKDLEQTGQSPMTSIYHQYQQMLPNEAPYVADESQVSPGSFPINDWSIWGMESFTGQQVGDSFNLLNMSSEWSDMM